MSGANVKINRQIGLFTFTRLVLNTNIRLIYPFQQILARGLGVNLPFLTIALSLRSISGLLVPFLSPLADRRGRKTAMLLGLGLFVVSTAVFLLAPVPAVFIGFLLVSFLGAYLFTSSVQAQIGDQVPFQRRGRVLSILELSWSLSFAIGMPLVGWLINRLDWLAPFACLGLLAAAAWVLVRGTVPPSPPAGSTSGSFWQAFRQVSKSTPAMAGLGVTLVINVMVEITSLVFGLWTGETFHLDVLGLGSVAAVIGVAQLSGELLTAVVVDRFGKERMVRAGFFLAGCAAMLLPWLDFHLWAALGGLFLLFLGTETAYMSNLPLLTEAIPEMRATVLGGNAAAISLGRLIAAGLMWLYFSLGFQAAMLTVAFFAILGLAILQHVKGQSKN